MAPSSSIRQSLLYRRRTTTCILYVACLLLLLIVSPCNSSTVSSGSEPLAPLPWNTQHGDENFAAEHDDNMMTMMMTPRDLQLEDGTLCDLPLTFDDTRHKRVYTVGVLAIRGADAAFAEFNKTFSDYLTKVVGTQRYNGDVEFVMKPLNFITLFSDVEDKLVDYIYVNPSAYSCIESEYDANSLASQVSKRVIGGNVYNLKKFGGVIATLAEREDINSIQDLQDKVVAAASISGLGSGQMQFKEMIDHGLNHLQDPKQLVFTSNQGKVVKGVLNGDFDVGFVRTDQLERSKDADGNPVDLSKFKIIDPKEGLHIDGTPFPFESSTDLYAEWNIAALTHVDTEISRAVQRAMFRISDYANVGNAILACYEQNVNNTQYCDDLPLNEIYDGPIRCDMDRETALLAVEASSNGKYSAWTTSLSYMQLRSMQEATGFISMEEETNIWRCIRSAEIYDAISCPAGTLRKSKDEVATGCSEVGLECAEGYQCLCRPCEIPYELVCVDSVRVGDSCVSLAIFLPSVILPLLAIVGVLVHYYVEHKRKQSDSIWVVKPEELKFDEPPTVVGRGTFGLVLLADYRGTQVAVKRVIPPSSRHSHSFFDVSATSSQSSSTGDDLEDDLELGLKSSMHPGIRTTHGGNKKNSRLAQSFQDGYKSSHSGGFGAAGWCCGPLRRRTDEEKQNSRLKEMFINEIRQLARLRHPCITTVMGAVMPSLRDEPMLVMEYMSHGSLRDCLEDDSIQLKPEQMLAILQDVAQGLRFLHTASPQVVHGDLKASNVLVDTNFCAKVTDFGLSAKKQIGAVGTPYWMAPELLQGSVNSNSTATDVYSFGIVIYELYSRKSPYEGEPYDDVIQEVCDPDIRKRPPVPLNCPVKIARLMQDCLLHSADERPAAELLDMTLKVEMKVKERTSRLEALNRELEEANKKIASASEMQLQHFACMSHEIRTPLNCIIGMSSLLEETELNPMQRESLEMIVSSGRLLRQIVDDVLDYSKLESGNAEVLIKDINLQETLNAVIHLIKTSPITEQKKLRICTTYDSTLPEFIKTDSRRIQQILFNLLGNAIKFSKPDCDVELAIRIQNEAVVFTVTDFGKGIDKSDYTKIFEPFRQTGTGLTNAEGGTGLGLSITKKLAAALGGNISVESEVNSWTTFTVILPFTNRSIVAEELSSRLKTTTIFLVGKQGCESVKRIEENFKTFNVDYSFLPTSRDLARIVATEGALSPDGRYICMVDETLYDKETYDIFHQNCRSCLVTFGPDFSVEETRKHFRSIIETFPSVLISNLGDFAQEISLAAKGQDMSKLQVKTKSPLSTLKVLIAEDNLVNQKVLTRILNRLEVKSVSVVGDGDEAVKREASEYFDLVLMDMQMPKMDGLEACQLINQREGGHQKAKIIFVTAHVSDTFRQTCLDNGAAGYLPKPCTVDAVKEVLNHVVGMGSMFCPVYNTSWNSDTGVVNA